MKNPDVLVLTRARRLRKAKVLAIAAAAQTVPLSVNVLPGQALAEGARPPAP